MTSQAIVRDELEKLPMVSRTWFEWDIEHDKQCRTLIVEVLFDTDPNSPKFNQTALEEIMHLVQHVLINQTTMMIHRLKVVPSNVPRD
jgi:hypothetical protein